MREEAINEYHELLAADAGLTSELFARLKRGMSAGHLLYGAREIGVSLRPHFLTRAQYDRLVHASETLAGAFEKLSKAMHADASLMARVGLSEQEMRLALVEPGYKYPAVTTRLDAFVKGDEVKFVEYNAENPSSLTDQSGLNQILFEIPALEKLAESYRLRQFDTASVLLKTLHAIFAEWSGRGAVPNVAVVDWENLPTRHEFMLLRNYFVGCGVPTIICTPDELEYDGGVLHRGDFRIDLVYKRVIIHELLERCGESCALLRAYAERAVCLVNNFRCKPLHKKAAFALITDDANARWFTDAERQVIHECVPWTRRVEQCETTHDGARVDLIEHVRRHRERFMLKPNDDYGGRGLSFGAKMSAPEWDTAIESALANDFVVQEALELQTEVFPVFNEGGWALQPMYVDTNPFLFCGRVEGAMVRLSTSHIVNVTSGGGETGFFVIEERLD
jgi:hypothetical protein